jgi:hypothetical protein
LDERYFSLVLVCSVVFVILGCFSLLSFDPLLECLLRAVIRGHSTLGGCIAMTGNNDIFRHGCQKLVLITGVDAEFEPIDLRPIGWRILGGLLHTPPPFLASFAQHRLAHGLGQTCLSQLGLNPSTLPGRNLARTDAAPHAPRSKRKYLRFDSVPQRRTSLSESQ